MTWASNNLEFTYTGYNVYLDPNEANVADGTADVTATDADADPNNLEFVPASALAEGITYYWRVEAIDPNGGVPTAYSSPVWSFKTTLSSAGSMITPVGAVASTEMSGIGRFAVDCINGAGLTGLGHNIADADMWMANGIYSDAASGIVGNPPVEDYDPEIVFDLGGYYDVDVIREWGYNAAALPVFAPDEVDVYTSTDDITYTFAGTVNFTLAPGVDGYLGDMHAVSLSDIRYIKLDIMNSHDGAIFGPTETGTNGGTDGRSLCGISEIRFYGEITRARVLADPVPLTVPAGEDATFSVSAEFPSGDTPVYDWYEESDLGTSLSSTDSLTIYNVQAGEEGNYYCDISGDDSIVSASAQLLTKRLISHWPLDSSLTDVEGGWNGSLPAGNTTINETTVHLVGSGALDFGGADPNNVVTIDGSEDYFNFYTRGYTASFWVKAPADAVAVALFNKWDVAGLSHYRSGLPVQANVEGAAVNGVLTADEWTFVTATYDVDPNTLTLYVNGLPVQQLTGVIFGASGSSSAPVTIGGPGVGIMDDVKMYSYALSAAEISQAYTNGAGIQITSQPDPVTVAAGGSATFNVEVTSPEGVTPAYAWFHDGSPVGTDSNSLMVTNVQLAEEGNYYCEINGVPSESAQLLTKRLVGHWKLDDDETDSVALTVPGAPTHDGTLPVDANSVYIPDAPAGLSGNSLYFGSDPNNVVTIAGSEDYFNFYTRGYTASFWVKAPSDALAVPIFNKWDGTGFSHYRWGPWVYVNVNGVDSYSGITVDEWNFVTATYDADTEILAMYVNGLPAWEIPDLVFGVSGTSTAPVTIGNPSVGAIDDVKLYSYAISAAEIAQEMATGSDQPVCTDRPAMDIAPVGDLDCVVNLLDFAELALGWLDDGNVYP